MDCNANIDHENQFGETAICFAAKHGYLEVFRYLLTRNASFIPYRDKMKPYFRDIVVADELAEDVYGRANIDMM